MPQRGDFECPVCSDRFGTHEGLQRHEKVLHPAERPQGRDVP